MLDMAIAAVHGGNYCRNIYISTPGWLAGHVSVQHSLNVAGVVVP